jgi:hypothetical protein
MNIEIALCIIYFVVLWTLVHKIVVYKNKLPDPDKRMWEASGDSSMYVFAAVLWPLAIVVLILIIIFAWPLVIPSLRKAIKTFKQTNRK